MIYFYKIDQNSSKNYESVNQRTEVSLAFAKP